MIHMMQKIVEKTVLAFYLLFFILVIIYGNFVRGIYKYERPTAYLLFYAILGSLFFLGLFYLLKNWRTLKNPKLFMPILAFIAFVPRYIWMRLIPTVPQIDFLRYHNYALALLKGDYDAYLEIRGVFPHLSGYPLVLSHIYKIFGDTVAVGKWFNIFVSIISVLLIYLLAREVFGDTAGQMAGLIYALYPADIMYITLLASEHIFLSLFLLALYLFVRFSRQDLGYGGLLKFILVGVVMAVAHIIRPVSSLLFPPILLYLLFFQKVDISIKEFLIEKTMVMGIIILSFLITLGGLNLVYIDKVQVPLGKTGGGFNMYVGTDPERDGMWNPNAWKIIEEFDHDFDKVHGEAQRRAIRRIFNDPRGFIGLAEGKFAIQWSTDDYAYYWSMLELYPETKFSLWIREHSEFVNIFAQSYYMSFILIACVGAWMGLRSRKIPDGLGLFAMIVLIFVAAHILIEVQSRYHHPVVPFFILTAVMAMGYIFDDLDHMGNGELDNG